jgi:hypothetical protein
MLASRAFQESREREIIERVGSQLIAWNLREPAIVFLTMHAPLAFLGSQFLVAAQPFVGLVTGDAFARDFALLLQDPRNVELLVSHLEKSAQK